ncbi:MAG: amidase [Nitrospinaceae bacterium]|jgi:aspartyl-tRNA(Asn)/glutamyl-tRNA(Gln) amidotransferase subunit A|nr:amidase [Nitrospinaceae bacterium]MBT3433349.1 amidase [Nitrospinaceae bacterium]MBT3820307.1 amidase [Nitrospinaceae bacterium]MBT4092804.1 amidase [Nitrospinaceae bacterium]MBT4432570.1 amidase [Nitrospinaceae bacterium]
MKDDALCFMTVHELGEKIRRLEVSPVEVVEAHIRRIEAVNGDVLGFLNITAEMALKQAKKAEDEIVKDDYRGPLHGIPYGVKDIIDTAGVCTTRGSSIFQNNVPTEDAHCVAQLKKSGAILLGKTHTQEFASGPLSLNPFFGTVRNPWDRNRTTGGSSSGSAASVAARMAPVALGTDTGSSIRGPSALCGLVGLKPTHGRVSLSGVCPNTLSFDHVGPLTRSVQDAALILQVIAGYDERDPFSRDVPVPDFAARLGKDLKGMKLGLCPDLYSNAEVDNEISEVFDNSIDVFRELGAEVKNLSFAYSDQFEEVFQVFMSAEFLEFHRPIYEKNSDGYGEIARKAVESRMGTESCDDLVRAQRKRELLRREVLKLFDEVDVIVTPTLPCVAPPIDTWKAVINGKEVDYTGAITRPFLTPHNMTGCPSIAVPMGFSKDGLPVSVQIIGRHWAEAEVLRAAHAFEVNSPDLLSKSPPS